MEGSRWPKVWALWARGAFAVGRCDPTNARPSVPRLPGGGGRGPAPPRGGPAAPSAGGGGVRPSSEAGASLLPPPPRRTPPVSLKAAGGSGAACTSRVTGCSSRCVETPAAVTAEKKSPFHPAMSRLRLPAGGQSSGKYRSKAETPGPLAQIAPTLRNFVVFRALSPSRLCPDGT